MRTEITDFLVGIAIGLCCGFAGAILLLLATGATFQDGVIAASRGQWKATLEVQDDGTTRWRAFEAKKEPHP